MGYYVQPSRDPDGGVVMFTIVLAIIAALGFIVGAGVTDKQKKPLDTVTHEGHWWVVAEHYFVHHPNCPCTAKPEVEP